MIKTKFLTLLVGLLGAGAGAGDNNILSCDFTEPFYSLELNLQSGELIKVSPDWDSDKPEIVRRVVDTDLNIKVMPGSYGPTITASSAEAKVLTATLNFEGSDGMSDFESAFEVTHHLTAGHKLYGACTIGNLKSFVVSEIPNDTKEFAGFANQAIGLCMNRAVSDWTIDPSEYQPDQSVFHVLYNQELVPGEPGNVSSTFSSAEGEALSISVAKAKTPPEDGTSYNRIRSAMWEHCLLYGQFLQSRYVLSK